MAIAVMETKEKINVNLRLALLISCVDKKRNSKHFEEIKGKQELKEIDREIDKKKTNMEKKKLEAFQSKSISAFATAVTL